MSDLGLGVRLAVGGGRTSLARFTLSAIGITIATAVLLIAASVGTMLDNREQRQNLNFPNTEKVEGVDPLAYSIDTSTFRGDDIFMRYVYPTGPNMPSLAGIPTAPKPGEAYFSPALAELLRSDEGELLRPRFADYTTVGEIGKEGVMEPGDLVVWLGADESLAESGTGFETVYAFGSTEMSPGIDGAMLSVVLIGAVALLLPVLIFVSSASRIAGAERDRRLSALRLVGSGSRQVRRIAAAESLVSALAGLVLGAAVFLVARQYAENVRLFDVAAYTSDIVPNPVLALLVAVAIPGLAVGTALIALRRTIIEPLGVVRNTKPVRRRAWWRFALIIIGIFLLVTQAWAEDNTDVWAFAVGIGAALLLVGVPVLLPWLVERVVGRIRGGPSSWQLAIRRLQLDSGTSARVVGGVAVVLAGAVALQTVLMTVENDLAFGATTGDQDGPVLDARVTPDVVDQVLADIEGSPGVTAAHVLDYATAYKPGDTSNTQNHYLQVMDCAAAESLARIRNCADGDIYQLLDPMVPMQRMKPGEELEFRQYPSDYAGEFDETNYERLDTWVVPDTVEVIESDYQSNMYAGGVVVTPGALAGATLPTSTQVTVKPEVDPAITSDQLEQIRNTLAPYSWRASMYSYNTADDLTQDQETFLAIRNALYIGSIFTLLLAGVSLLVLALEHIRERRRPLAVLAASGVPRSVLARSLLWQIALPIGLGAVVAMFTGIGLAALMMRLTNESLSIDWLGVAALTGSAFLLSVLVSAITLPFLRSATRLTSLRTE